MPHTANSHPTRCSYCLRYGPSHDGALILLDHCLQGNYKYAAVAVEYFSKWVEAKALRDVTIGALQKFFWQNIVCHFGVLKEVTVDNGKQFDCATFREFTTQLGTNLCFASVYHPQSNGAVERANGIIFSGINKNITELPKGKWADELPRVIWSHSTTESRTMKFPPSSYCMARKP
ncbi:uncharacterized protein LOC120709899 [Panicum virgatum]|uniref:uncharacterized protein LOC120709899 n=1 Tax=Panicum virgatum TaxID=38727 RepID=UPI0019D5359C|nr:uncharacterized protein LOC120709899 [Panicum virgatum]